MKRRSVLLVDDDAHILEVLEMRLTALGFDVTSALGPEEALRLITERGFDVALVDLRMEPIDGIALTRAAHEHQARLPVLIMTRTPRSRTPSSPSRKARSTSSRSRSFRRSSARS
jgi:two-component system response regulator GlrR